MVQLEFPFTRKGQFQAYNNKQIGHMYQLYREYHTASSIAGTPHSMRAWEQVYIDSGMAKDYADENRWMFEEKPIEYHNDKVMDNWNRRPIAQHKPLDYDGGF